MKPARHAYAAIVLAVAGCSRAAIAPPTGADASTAVSDAASTPAPDAATDAGTPDAPDADADDAVLLVPRTPSARPKAAEWSAVDETSIGQDCVLGLVREWARVRCGPLEEDAGSDSVGGNTNYESVVLLAGARADVTASLEGAGGDLAAGTRAIVTFRLRPGDRRVFQLNTLLAGSGYGDTPISQVSGVTLSETWLEGARGPTIALDSTD
jgi:hypothetical protein